MTLPQPVADLVDRFHRNRDAYLSGQYNETQVRREFIDPMFVSLGWDMDNRSGYAEAYKDVIHEDAIKIGGATRAPDYCFRIGGTRKFFLEAKKPAVKIQNDLSPAYQLRRYAWSAKLPLSVLTDFEEFALYDCRVKPAPNDSPATARVMYLQYADYERKWDDIESVLSRDAVLKGSFDKYADSTRAKRGTAEVDAEFLKEIEAWRDSLARNIAIRNPQLDQRALNTAVQQTIDRIIFLRLCEDRGIEDYGRLQQHLNGDNVYARLLTLFREADDRYNSGLFHFRPEKDRPDHDRLTPTLAIDDKVLKDVISRLYYPESPYEFSVLPADILGQVYEQFLGKVIRLTKGHQAKVEEKPEVRKAGGVYYTPTYIVEYIVKNTVGKLLEGKSPKDIEGAPSSHTSHKSHTSHSAPPPLRILDPACGSGSFLINAYQFLLDWYRDQYAANPDKHARGRNPRIYQRAQSDYALTVSERKRILLDHIYGVDIDPQAVEVTKLSLLLKVLEGENNQSIQNQLALFHQRALPDLNQNIKCGNSLIAPDFYNGQQVDLFNEEELYRINAFDWNTEFPFLPKDGGFDAVIGNPPYIRVRIFRELYPNQAEYLERQFSCATHVWDVYLLFFEKALQVLKEKGIVSFIAPIQTLHQPNCESLRRILLTHTRIHCVTDLSRLKIFQNAIVKNCILVCSKSDNLANNKILVATPVTTADLLSPSKDGWPQKLAAANPGLSLKASLLSPSKLLCEKLREGSWELQELCYVTFGLRSCAKGRGQGGKERLITPDCSGENAKPYLEGRDMNRYAISPKGHYIKYLPAEMYSPRSPELFETEKIISRSMLSNMTVVATLDNGHFYVEQSLVCIVPHGILTDVEPLASLPLAYLLGAINSRLQSFYFSTFLIDFSLGGGLIHATPGTQGRFLIPRAAASGINSMATLVHRMLDLHKRLQTANTDHDRTILQRQVAATDQQIDRLVYELYGLSKEEIAIVEGSAHKITPV